MNKSKGKRGIAHVITGICIAVMVFISGMEKSYAAYQTPVSGKILIEPMSMQLGAVNGYYPKNTRYRVIWSGLFYNPVSGEVSKIAGGDNFAALAMDKPTSTMDALGCTNSSRIGSIVSSTTGTFVFENLTLDDISKFRHVSSFTIGQDKTDYFMYTKSYNNLPFIYEDKTAPVINSVSKDSDEWRAEIILNVEASDRESGIPTDAYSWDNGATWGGKAHKITDNGTYLVIARDGAGNCTTPQSIVISNIDKEPPIIGSMKAVTLNPFNGYGQEVQITATASDTKCGMHDFPYSWDDGSSWVAEPVCKVRKNGTYKLFVRDKAGNQTASSVEVSTVDADSPEILKLNQYADHLVNGYTKAAKLAIAAVDALSGMHSYPFSYNGGSNWTAKDEFEVKENGIYEVLVRDAVHNVGKGSLAIANIDKEGPVIKGIEKEIENEWNGYGTAMKYRMEVMDEKAGLCDTPYSWSKGSSWTTDNEFTFTQNGKYEFRMKDVLGNTTQETVSVDRIDIKKPVIGAVYVSPVNGKNGYSREALVEILAEDDEAGLHTTAYSYDAGMNWSKENQHTISENGDCYLRVRDGVQNATSGVIQIKCIDRNEPQIQSLELKLNSPANHYARTGIISIHAQDYQVGLDVKPYSFDEGRTWTEQSTYTVKYNGNYPVLVRDMLGNIAKKTIQVKSLDGIVPSVTITGNPVDTVKGNVILTVQATDRQSGIASLWYQNDETRMKTLIDEYWDYNSETKEIEGAEKIKQRVIITENGSYTFYTYDVLDNCAEYKIRVTKIDKSSEKGDPGKGENEESPKEEEPEEEPEEKPDDEDEITQEEEEKDPDKEELTDKEILDRKIILKKSYRDSEDYKISGNGAEFAGRSESQNRIEREEVYVKKYLSEAPEKLTEEESISSAVAEQRDLQNTPEEKISAKKIIITACGILLFLIAVSGIILWRMGIFKKEEEC